ncbi:MAG: DUF5916 domain-containing protein [Bacteroidota bacterium]
MSTLTRIVCFTAVVLLLLSDAALAGDNPRSIRAIRTSEALKIDGYLTERVWRDTEPAKDFIQQNPNEGEPASEPTEIFVLYDDEALYFGCMMYDSEPRRIVARRTRRDNEVESDYISIRIDSFHDHQTAFEFTVNASASKTDILIYNDKKDEDASWDVVWEVRTQLLSSGWSAEVKIPFHVLRFSEQSKQEWGINFIRIISRKQERDYWALIGRTESGFVSRFGHLEGLDDIPSPVRLELLPYVVGSGEFTPESTANPDGKDFLRDGGFDLKYGLTGSLTVDVTLNPDFGQVEADPAVLNLTTFETFFPEKRPFFIEGSQVLRFTTFGGVFGPGLFYSRRIGRGLKGDVSAPAGGYVLHEPTSTTILGAAKLTGKTPGGLAIGVLQAVTQEETATLVDSLGNRKSQVVEPFAHYNVVRLKQDIWQNSNVGGIVTSVAKNYRRPSFVAGVDWDLKFRQNRYVVDGFIAGSHTTNELEERITGSAGKIKLQKAAGKHWLWDASVDYTTKKYGVNDLGFFFRPNDYGSNGELRYREEVPGKIFRRYIVGLGYHLRMNFDGINLFRQVNWFGRVQFLNYWQIVLLGNYDAALYDDRESRGHGLYRKPKPYDLILGLESDPRLPVVGEFELGYSGDERGGRGFVAGVAALVRPLSWIEVSSSVRFNPVRNKEAWFANEVDPLDPFRVASLFGKRDTDEFDLTFRSTVTFAQDLTLQVYAQVFLAKGHYENIQELIAPSEFVPFAYTGNPDFNRKSLNTNVVLRWEYLPGSTLFLVWSQARRGEGNDYFTSFGHNFRDTFKVPTDNVLLLKLSYWWSL